MLQDIKRKELVKLFLLSIFVVLININPLLVNAAVYSVSSNIEQYRVGYITQTYFTEESENFIYKYTIGDKDIIDIVKKETERSFEKLSEIYNIKPSGKITIIIFPDIYTMNKTLKLPDNEKSIGLYYCEFISILSPKAWINQSRNIETVFLKTGPIAHELTHYFVDKKTKGNYPIWFTEGVALYFEKQLTGFEWGTDIKNTTKQYTVEELTRNFEKLDGYHAYRRSYDLINNYVTENSEEKLMTLMENLGQGYKVEDFKF